MPRLSLAGDRATVEPMAKMPTKAMAERVLQAEGHRPGQREEAAGSEVQQLPGKAPESTSSLKASANCT